MTARYLFVLETRNCNRIEKTDTLSPYSAGVPGNPRGGGGIATCGLQEESALTAAILRFDINNPTIAFDGVLTYDADGNFIERPGVEIYAPGFRNPYDTVLHSNGNIYGTDNGKNCR